MGKRRERDKRQSKNNKENPFKTDLAVIKRDIKISDPRYTTIPVSFVNNTISLHSIIKNVYSIVHSELKNKSLNKRLCMSTNNRDSHHGKEVHKNLLGEIKSNNLKQNQSRNTDLGCKNYQIKMRESLFNELKVVT